MVPQLFMITKQAGKVETYTAHFVVLMSRSFWACHLWTGSRGSSNADSGMDVERIAHCEAVRDSNLDPEISDLCKITSFSLRQMCCVLRWRFISRIFAWLFWYTGYHELAEGYVENVRCFIFEIGFVGAVHDRSERVVFR